MRNLHYNPFTFNSNKTNNFFRQLVSVVVFYSMLLLPITQLSFANPVNGIPSAKKPQQSCFTCSAGGSDNLFAQLGTLGRKSQLNPFDSTIRSRFDGSIINFVSTAKGNLAFATTDFFYPTGSLPLIFQRTYASDRTEDRGLGIGWSFTFDDRITVQGNSATMMTSNGDKVLFKKDQLKFVLVTANASAHQSFELQGNIIKEQLAGFTRLYQKKGSTFYLSEISDNNENKIKIAVEDSGKISKIEDSHGGYLTLNWQSSNLSSITDKAGHQVTFEKKGNLLGAVKDANGNRWEYEYEAGRLSLAKDPMQRNLLESHYDQTGHVTASGDASGQSTFKYNFSSNGVSKRTVVTDSLENKAYYDHDAKGLLVKLIDAEGNFLDLEHNVTNSVTRSSDSSGNETKFEYDKDNRLIHRWSNDGSDSRIDFDSNGRVTKTTENGEISQNEYDSRGNIVSVSSSDAKKSYRAERDVKGNSRSLKNDAGREVRLEHDVNGRETTFTITGIGKFQNEFDSAGNIKREILPSGFSTNFDYDERNLLRTMSDSKGRSFKIERDASGVPMAFVGADGKGIRVVRDKRGRITTMINSQGKSRSFAYNANGALTEFADAAGKVTKFQYSKTGRLLRTTSSNGVGMKFTYDRFGRMIASQQESVGPRIFNASFSAAVQYGFDNFCIDDGWSSDPFSYLFGNGCGDPFGGFGGGGWAGGETREQCIARHKRAADSAYAACCARAAGLGITAAAACLVASASLGSIGCIALGLIIEVAALVSCDHEKDAAYFRAPDGC